MDASGLGWRRRDQIAALFAAKFPTLPPLSFHLFSKLLSRLKMVSRLKMEPLHKSRMAGMFSMVSLYSNVSKKL